MARNKNFHKFYENYQSNLEHTLGTIELKDKALLEAKNQPIQNGHGDFLEKFLNKKNYYRNGFKDMDKLTRVTKLENHFDNITSDLKKEI